MLLVMTGEVFAQYSLPTRFCFKEADAVVVSGKKVSLDYRITVFQGDSLAYRELQSVVPDSTGRVCIDIGKGRGISGKYDSVIWSVGTYYLEVERFLRDRDSFLPRKRFLIREPENLNAYYEQGTEQGKDPYGRFVFPHSRKKRPRRIQVDLSTTYANLAYPADTYPIYRHFEWIDDDRDGLGNSFTVSFSENTRNEFVMQTRSLGDITLYAVPFQQLLVDSGPERVVLEMTKPVDVISHGNTYRIKGPLTLIYYFEW